MAKEFRISSRSDFVKVAKALVSLSKKYDYNTAVLSIHHVPVEIYDDIKDLLTDAYNMFSGHKFSTTARVAIGKTSVPVFFDTVATGVTHWAIESAVIKAALTLLNNNGFPDDFRAFITGEDGLKIMLQTFIGPDGERKAHLYPILNDDGENEYPAPFWCDISDEVARARDQWGAANADQNPKS